MTVKITDFPFTCLKFPQNPLPRQTILEMAPPTAAASPLVADAHFCCVDTQSKHAQNLALSHDHLAHESQLTDGGQFCAPLHDQLHEPNPEWMAEVQKMARQKSFL